MTLTWQDIAVVLILLGAVVYVGRRAQRRLRAFRLGRRAEAAACETGCGTCGAGEKSSTASTPSLVEIKRAPVRRVAR